MEENTVFTEEITDDQMNELIAILWGAFLETAPELIQGGCCA